MRRLSTGVCQAKVPKLFKSNRSLGFCSSARVRQSVLLNSLSNKTFKTIKLFRIVKKGCKLSISFRHYIVSIIEKQTFSYYQNYFKLSNILKLSNTTSVCQTKTLKTIKLVRIVKKGFKLSISFKHYIVSSIKKKIHIFKIISKYQTL